MDVTPFKVNKNPMVFLFPWYRNDMRQVVKWSWNTGLSVAREDMPRKPFDNHTDPQTVDYPPRSLPAGGLPTTASGWGVQRGRAPLAGFGTASHVQCLRMQASLCPLA